MDSRARIAFISEHASPTALLGGVDAGGQNVYVDEVSRRLGDLGYRVDVLTRRDDPNVPPVIDWAPGVRIVNLTAGPLSFVPKDDLWTLMPVFRDAACDVAIADGGRYDLVHSNFWMSGWVALQMQRRGHVPVVHIFHATGKTKQRHQGSADTSPAGRLEIEEEVVRGVDRLIAQCPSEESELIEEYGADRDRVVVIPSAVNTTTFHPVRQDEARRQLGLDPDQRLVVYVGRMLPRKDVRNVLRAVALLVHRTALDVNLLLVGGESARPDPVATPEIGVLQALAAELGIAGRVRFEGKRQPADLHAFYSAGDVVVTTPWYEPFGLTPLEGMACGRPVIGSAVGGITFTIADGETGYLVPPRDPDVLAQRLADLFQNPALCRRMGLAARSRVEREFTWPLVAQRTASLYESLLVDAKAGAAAGAVSGGRAAHGTG